MTTLERSEARDTAAELLSRGQRSALLSITVLLLALPVLAALGLLPGHIFGVTAMLMWLIAAITVVYVIAIGYKAVLIFTGLRGPRESGFGPRAVEPPTYTILVPLYREGAVLRPLINNLLRLDYPPHLLQVLVLIEDDDDETMQALAGVDLPPHFEVVLIPESFPRTKPKACNVGLARATGQFCVIYDAEDRPEPDQLLKAVRAFSRSARNVVCVQAELQYFNPATNVLTRWFAAEYAGNFSLVLPGLTKVGAPVPLGGTSNHFRTAALRSLGGWDGYNVTEDADLGIWIARAGFRVAMIDSVTWEEANSKVGNWVRQRSRWIKGYIQTYLVHMRNPLRLLRELGLRNFLAFQLVVGGTPLTLLFNPVFWILTIAYIVLGQEWVSALFPTPVFYLGMLSMLAGNFLAMWLQMAASMKRGLYPSVLWSLAVFGYWVLMSVAAYKALGQLLNRRLRHHWEKTTHGLVVDDQAVGPAA
jgi:glycosyltransferase XagB